MRPQFSGAIRLLVVKRISKNEIVITIGYEIECELDVYIPQFDSYHLENTDFYVTEPDFNKTYALGCIVLPFLITIRFIFDEIGETISST